MKRSRVKQAKSKRSVKPNYLRVAGERLCLRTPPGRWVTAASWPPRAEDTFFSPDDGLTVIPYGKTGRILWSYNTATEALAARVVCDECKELCCFWWTSDRIWRLLPKALRDHVLCLDCFREFVPARVTRTRL